MKATSAQAAGLLPLVRPVRSRPQVAVCRTLGASSIPAQVLAGNMQHRVNVEFPLILPQVIEADILRVADEPGRLVVERGGPFLQGPDPKSDRHSPALAAQPPAGRYGCSWGVRYGVD